jgi:tetratricopeptide (TPR) repeat protein
MISDSKQKILELFASGRNLYKLMKFKEARDFFEKALAIDPEDGPSKEYLKRCNEFMESPPGPDWDGVYIMKNK